MPVLWDEWASAGAGGAVVAAGGDGSGDRGETTGKLGGDLSTLKATFQDLLAHNKTCPGKNDM